VAPWLVIAQEVLVGKWAKADRSTTKSLLIGLKGAPGTDARKAETILKKGLK
jgi:hypothetical protein